MREILKHRLAVGANGLKDAILCAVFPSRCRYCGALIAPHEELCEACETDLPRIQGACCSLCGYQKSECVCRQKKQKYKGICAPFYYEGSIQKAVHRFKFEEKDFLAEAFADDMARSVQAQFKGIPFTCVTFVPFTEKQLRQREWNPSERLAEALAERLNLPCRCCLQKLYETETQHFLQSDARKGNVFGVFEATEPLNGQTILLVDDIKTTGATLSECAKMLRLAGADAVYAVTFAIAKKQRKIG